MAKQQPMDHELLLQWIESHVNSELTEEEAKLLEQCLSESPAARELYLAHCELHCDLVLSAGQRPKLSDSAGEVASLSRELYLRCCDLHGMLAIQDDGSQQDKSSALEDPKPAALVDIVQATTPASRPDSVRSSLLQTDWRIVASVVLACCLLLIAYPLGGSRTNKQLSNHNEAITLSGTSNEPIEGQQTVAMVTALHNCVWDRKTYEPGEGVEAGSTLEITTGLARLTFDNGVELVLQSPSRITTLSGHMCQLHYGSVAARVPPDVNGFAIQTNVAEVVDLGADYGVRLDEAGKLELHVFEGEAVIWPTDRRLDELHVTAGNSIVISSSDVEPLLGTAQPELFSEKLASEQSEDAIPQLPVTDGLALWLAADVNVTTDSKNRVITWHDISIGDNVTLEDAWQHETTCRPTLVENAIGNRPAIRFDGKASYLETAPLSSTKDQTLFFVFSRATDFDTPRSNEASLHKARQLINYNGPVHSRDSIRNTPQQRHQLQICDRLESGVYWGRVWATREGDDRGIHVGSVKCLDRQPTDIPVLLCYCYYASENRAALYINGILQGTDTAPLEGEYTSRKVIGRSAVYPAYFDGDMAEIAIYNQALSQAQIAEAHQYFAGRYGIEAEAIPDGVEQPQIP